uniref:WSN domain-containing protein n=1 Tax=Panagrellus redivivus TaxID=6233 RepID=A0A7E4WCT4_PANRE
MSSIKACRLAIVLLMCYVTWIHCINITTSDVTLNKKLTKQIANINKSINTALKPAFLTQLVQAAASQDQTIRDTMASVYDVPITGLLCLVTNYKSIWSKIQSTAFTLENVVSAATSKCFLFTSAINKIKTATAALTDKFSTSTPGLITPLPASFQKLVNGIVSFARNWAGATAPSDALTAQYTALVAEYKEIPPADKKKVGNMINWLKPFVAPKGGQSKNLQKTLDLLTPAVQSLSMPNSDQLQKLLNTLAKKLTSSCPGVATWLINKINKLPVSAATKADSTVTKIASNVAKYGGDYGPKFINTAEIQKYIAAAIAKKYNIILK